MKTKNRIQAQTATLPGFSPQFDEMTDPRDIVEHLTIAGFLKLSSHHFHIDEIIRFGDKVGKSAEALHLGYVASVDPSLGIVRTFPVPLMRRVYQVMAKLFNWGPLLDSSAASTEAAEAKAAERATRALDAAGGEVNDPEVAEAFAKVRTWLARQKGEPVNVTALPR